MLETIPPITEKLGKYWEQPDSNKMLIDESCAIMGMESFHKLAIYSCSLPTAAYEGKMWKCKYGPEWLLCWYGLSEKPGMVSINMRPIVIV